MAKSLTVRVDGIKEMKRKLRAEKMLGEPLRDAFQEIAHIGTEAVREAAPVRTGKLKGSVRAWWSKAPIPTSARIKISAKNRGYPYPRRVQWDPKSPRFGFASDAVKGVRARFRGPLQKAARQIELDWGR